MKAGEAAQALVEDAATLGWPLSGEAAARLSAYWALLQKWNAAFNLTAVRDVEAMRTQHFADCLAVVPALRRELGAGRAARLLDVGSGGGLPGVVLAVVEPAWSVTCVDAVGKKAAFIRQVAVELGLSNLAAVHGRVEDMACPAQFDVAICRAFGSLAEFTRVTRKSLSEQGIWVAMKGSYPQEEIEALPSNVKLFHVEPLRVPGLDAERCLVWMRPQ